MKTHRGRSWTARAACLLALSLLPFFPSLSHASLPPSDNQLLQIADNLDASKSLSFSYDLSGSLISKTQGGTVTEYLYDARNALTAVKQGASTLALFAYDAEGRRREKVGLDGLVRYVRDGESVLLETDVAGAAVVKYEQAGSRLVSLTHATQGRQYYLQDALGTTTNLTTAAGYIQATYQSGAWGSTRKTLGSSVNARLFTGKERDVETGLYYFGARYYDPETGRFLTEDPYQGDVHTPASLHRCLYAYGNPVRYVDIYGYYSLEEFGWHRVASGTVASGGIGDVVKYVKLW
ncbi:MAG: RHS repeat-associated core domain-containing protein [Nitrospirae bacterium]|nr:RHS repeat-associated core domain-containing protein [Nitrospirota bacterium]